MARVGDSGMEDMQILPLVLEILPPEEVDEKE